MTNARTKRTLAGRQLAKICPHVLALSGTPIVNRPKELYPILNMLRPDVFRSFHSFAHRYCKPSYKPWGWDYNGASNLGELHQVLKDTCMVRRLKVEVLGELPPKTRRVVALKCKGMAEYRQADKDFMAWLKRTQGYGKAAAAAKAERMVKMGYMKRLAAKIKTPAVVNWCTDRMRREKLVMFAHHQDMVQSLHNGTAQNTVVIDGQTQGRDRDLARLQFQSHPKVRGLIGSQAAITALTLTAAATVAFAELWWRPGDHSQAEDRVHRIGQDKPCEAIYLVAAGTIEEHICEVLQAKQLVTGATLDGGEAADLQIFDQLTERLLQ